VEFPAASVEWIGPGGRAFCSTCGTTIGAIDDDPIVALATGAHDSRILDIADRTLSLEDGQLR
jgi:hypothetical protein